MSTSNPPRCDLQIVPIVTECVDHHLPSVPKKKSWWLINWFQWIRGIQSTIYCSASLFFGIIKFLSICWRGWSWADLGPVGTGGVVVRYSRSSILIFCVSLPAILLSLVDGLGLWVQGRHLWIRVPSPWHPRISFLVYKSNETQSSHPPKDKLLNETEFRSFTFRIPRLHFIALARGGWL